MSLTFGYMFITRGCRQEYIYTFASNSMFKQIGMRTLMRYMFLPLVVGTLIFIGTCLIGPGSMPDMPDRISWDKLAHYGLFFLLSSVSLYDYHQLYSGAPPFAKWLFWGFILPVVYGGVIELLQMYVFTTRSAEWGDWFADVAGSLTALLLAIICLRKRKKSINNISL